MENKREIEIVRCPKCNSANTYPHDTIKGKQHCKHCNNVWDVK